MGQVDRKVGIYDAAGNPINDGNPLPITGSVTGGGGSTGQADKSLFTEGASLASPIAGVYNETLGADPSEDSAIAIRATVKRALHVNHRDASGNEVGTGGNPVRTDPTGVTSQPVSDGGGTLTVDAVDGGLVSLGNTTDVEASGNGSLIAIAKRIRTLLGGTVAVSVSGTPTVTANIGTTGGVALDATLTGGTARSIGRGQVDDTSTTTPSEDAYGDLRITPKRGLHANLRDQSGVELATAGNPLRTDPTGSTSQPVSDGGGSLTVDGTVAVTGSTTPVPTRGSFTDHSGSIATGGAAQVLAAANPTRVHLFIQNNGVDDLWFNFGSTAVTAEPSIQIPVGAGYTSEPEFVSDQSVSIISATTGVTFTCKEA